MLRLNVNMKSSDELMTIGQVASRFGLATHVLRHWESAGLLSPMRVEGARRRYHRDDLYRVASILRAKEAGFPLDDIREMITAESPATRQRVLRRHHAELSARIASAQAALHMIEGALTCPHDDIISCPHFQALLRKTVESAGGDP